MATSSLLEAPLPPTSYWTPGLPPPEQDFTLPLFPEDPLPMMEKEGFPFPAPTMVPYSASVPNLNSDSVGTCLLEISPAPQV